MNLNSLLLILMFSFGFFLGTTLGSHCDSNLFVLNMEKLCIAYYGFGSNYKRETGGSVENDPKRSQTFPGYGNEGFRQYLRDVVESENLQSIPTYPYAWQIHPRINRPLIRAPFPGYRKPTRVPASDGSVSSESKERHNPQWDPVEPQDFDTFNYWYLNPVYHEVDFKEGNERWKRNGFKDFMHRFRGLNFPNNVMSELWSFFHSKCCGDGCHYPKEYAKLDERINFCKMY